MFSARLLLWSLLPLCVAGTAQAQPALDNAVQNDLTLGLFADGLSQPTAAQFLPDGRLLIVQKTGQFLVTDGTAGATPTMVGSITVPTNSERGLLNVAVDPQFATTNRLYIYYSAGNSQSVGFVTLNGTTLGTPTPLLSGLSSSNNHDGGALVFGPDGHLYIGVGDTGCNCNCQPGTADNYFGTCLTRLHGKVLRIDRDGNIPADNPLVGVAEVPSCGNQANCNTAPNVSTGAAPRAEIWNWGFRNPWRMAFDEQTGFLWIGDVGEVTWEEITISTGGGIHHGWPYREGNQGQAATICGTITPPAVGGTCKDPAYFFPHAGGDGSVSGGVFSNHCSWPQGWAGRYWFADYTDSSVWSLEPNTARDGVTGPRQTIVNGAGGVVHFFNGPDGAVYFVSITNGQIWRLAPQAPVNCGGPDAGPGDTGVAEDAGSPPADSGVPPVDSGVPPADSGVPPADSGVPPVDAGPGVDASTPGDTGVAVDSGAAIDSGATPTEEEDSGCGCTSVSGERAPSSAPGLAMIGLLMGLALGFRKRNR